MIGVPKAYYLDLSKEEYSLIRAAMDLYQPAIASDFTEDPAFDRLVTDTAAVVVDHALFPDTPYTTMQIAVIWNALNYWIDVRILDLQQVAAANALIKGIAPYADFETDVAAYYNAIDRKEKTTI